MDLTDGTTIAWIVGALVALAVVGFACWIAWTYANDEELV
jgi:hypothetical protein